MAAVLAVGLASTELTAQAGSAAVTGRVMDAAGAPIAGAEVVVATPTGTQRAALSDNAGSFRIAGLPAGSYRVEAHMLGYTAARVDGVALEAGATAEVDLVMNAEAVTLEALEILASRAIERKTPVAYTNVEKTVIQRELASRDIPLVLNTTPSVYATGQGGGAGDARVNVRGFNQRNVAIMINGVPVNDMENGWVYWSNWDGVGDATSTIQLQRGLSAVNLATPAVGGVLNIITDPASMKRGGSIKQEAGSWGFLKTTVMGSSGLINDRFAVMAAGVRKTGDGYYKGTWTDAWAYYLAASYKINNANRLDFFALGAPQRHGQNLYKQNIGAYDAEFARSLDDYDPAALGDYTEAGRDYNENYNTVSCSYGGAQAVGSDTFERYDCGFLNERENFYHKPQVNLNWYYQPNDRVLLTTVGYYSGGKGGGTGTAGSMVWDYSGPSRIVNWDATIERNRTNPTGSRGILRNSRNNQWTIGAISKLRYQASEPLTVHFGLDWRTAEIEHYREVRDLLGGDYFVNTSNEFRPNEQVGLGEKIAYDFTNTVDWMGGFAQAEYAEGPFSAYGMAGVSTIKYSHINHFKMGPDGGERTLEPDNIVGYQVKGGGLYNFSDQFGLFANAGYVTKVPIVDAVIDDFRGALNPDPQSEKFISFEVGANFSSPEGQVAGKVNLYRTAWKDRTLTRFVQLTPETDGIAYMLGLNALHQGVEAELAYQPHEMIRFDAAASFGDWYYTDDVDGTFKLEDRSTSYEGHFSLKDLKVGDAPQTQFAYAVSLFPTDGAFMKLTGRTYARHFSDFNPEDRDYDPATESPDRTQSWEVPAYTIFELHAGYDLPLGGRLPFNARLDLSAFNLFDATYIQDALDNSRFNAWDDDHDADDAEVYFGLPRRINVGLRLTY